MAVTCRRRCAAAGPLAQVPEKILAEVCDAKPMSTASWAFMMILELGVWAGLYWRDYSYGPNIAVAHYLSFQTITDLSCWRLPADRRCWWHPFRATVALSFIFLDASLLLNGAEKPGLLPVVRMALCSLRLVHALGCMYIYGPGLAQLRGLPKYVHFHVTEISAVPLILFLWGFVAWFCPYVFILMHYNYGEIRLDGPLTALQDTYVVTVVLKAFMADILMASPLQAGISQIVACLLFSGQYPLIFDTYWKPLLKMGHLLAETFFGTLGLLYLFFDLRFVPEMSKVSDASKVCAAEPV